MTFPEYLAQERAKNPVFRRLWDRSEALRVALTEYVRVHEEDAAVARDPRMLTDPERHRLVYELMTLLDAALRFDREGKGWQLRRRKREENDAGADAGAGGVV